MPSDRASGTAVAGLAPGRFNALPSIVHVRIHVRPQRRVAYAVGNKGTYEARTAGLERVFRRSLQSLQVSVESVLGLAIRVDVLDSQVAARDRTPAEIDVCRTRALVGI